jgi:hypothetical protein
MDLDVVKQRVCFDRHEAAEACARCCGCCGFCGGGAAECCGLTTCARACLGETYDAMPAVAPCTTREETCAAVGAKIGAAARTLFCCEWVAWPWRPWAR